MVKYMSSSFVVELNQNSASWSRPGEFECTLSQPISINEGDQLSFRMCSLDSNITDQDTILITQDETLTATFSYYEVNYNGTDKINSDGSAAEADFNYYAAYNDIATVTVTGINLEIVGYIQGDPNPIVYGPPIPGSYIIGNNVGVGSQVDPNVNFVAYFTYIDPAGDVKNINFTGSNAKFFNSLEPSPPGFGDAYYTDNADGTLQLVIKQPFTMRVGSLQFANVTGFWPGRFYTPTNLNLSFNYGSMAPRNGGDQSEYDNSDAYQVSDFQLGTITSTPTGTTGDVLDLQTINVTLKAGRYDPQSLAVQITQLFSSARGVKQPTSGLADQIYVSSNSLLTRTDDPKNSNMFFNLVPAIRATGALPQQSYTYNDGTANIPPYFIGVTEFSLEYNVGGGAVFQLSYCHMPLSNPGTAGEQNIGVYVTGDVGLGLRYNTVTSASGIAFHDLQPASFWQDKLGLREKLIVPLITDVNGLQYYTQSSLQRSITFGFQGLSSFLLPPTANPGTNPTSYPDFRKMSPIIPNDNPVYLNVTGQSRAIIGDTITVNTAGGYFLIECLNAFRSTGGYIDTTENRRYISAIVSTQYDSNNSITGFGDSDIAGYVHRGASYLISSVVVRILNPITKLPVVTLGPNNCIWLQIQKQLDVQSQSVAHVKKKPIIIKRVKNEEEEPVQTSKAVKAVKTVKAKSNIAYRLANSP